MNDQRIAYLRHHPSSDQLVLLITPPDLNTVMGRYGPARYVKGRGYDVPAGLVDQLRTFLDANRVILIDERATTKTAVSQQVRHQPQPECPHCRTCAPGNWRGKFCPGCGRKWAPIVIDVTAQARERATVECPSCATKVNGGARYCPECGTPVDQPVTITRSTLPITHDEPTLVGQILARLDELGPTPPDFRDRVKFFREMARDPNRQPETPDEAKWLAQIQQG